MPALTADSLDPDLAAAAISLRANNPRQWAIFIAEHPEFAALARKQDQPDDGIGSAKDYRPGKSWKNFDKNRTRRRRRPSPRPTSDMTMQDGSPLRIVTLGDVDVDGDPMTGGFDRYPTKQVCEDDDGEIWLAYLDGVHGEFEERMPRQDRAHHRLLEHCVLCGHLLPLKWPPPVCEFPEKPMPEGRFCHCNGCLRSPKRGNGRPRYCSKECERRMDNAMDRAKLRAKGAKSRKFDADADRIAQFRADMRERARQRKALDALYRFDWTGIWHVPIWVKRPASHRLEVPYAGVWKITLTTNDML